MTNVNTTATNVQHDPENMPHGTPPVGEKQAPLAIVNKLTQAFRAYEKATNSVQRAAAGLWSTFAEVGNMTKEEGEPILREFLKIARKDKDENPAAVKTAEQYASRIRKGWKAGVAPNEGEGANAFYARAQEAENGTPPANKSGKGEPEQGGERAKLMAKIREELAGFTNDELVELAKWIAHKNAKKAEKAQQAQPAAAAA